MNELGRGVGYDLLAAEEIFGNGRNQGGISAEKELLLAILADAIDCIWKYAGAQDGRSRRLFRDARQWLFASDPNATLSFVNLCDALSLDPSYIRRGIVDGVEKRLGPSSPVADKRKPRGSKATRNFKSGTRHKVRPRTLKV